MRAPEDRKIFRSILHTAGDVVPRRETGSAKELGESVGGVFELGVADGLAGLGHGDCGFIGRAPRPGAGMKVERRGHGGLLQDWIE